MYLEYSCNEIIKTCKSDDKIFSYFIYAFYATSLDFNKTEIRKYKYASHFKFKN